MNEAVITLKLSDNEIDLLVNSLEMLESTIVPCVDNGQWKVPYEQLKGDLQIIIITELPKTQYYADNESYYRGRQIWSGYTEVEVI